MKKIILATVTAMTLLGSAGVASATEYRGWGWGWGQGTGERREARQEAAIEQGRRNGSLTPSEYRALQAEQANIDRLQNRAKADGVVTRRESAEIRNAQNSATRHIYQETHDRDGRSPWYRRWY
jgi:hypothetical protein